VWLSGSKQGWQPRGRWFKSSWGQSVFVGGNVRLGYWEVAASLFYNFFDIKNKIKNKIMVKDFHVIIPPKFLWSFHHSFKIFFDPKKNFF
jgi:hypothetical protein